jgi:predicted MFS family arabinose efflux permease
VVNAFFPQAADVAHLIQVALTPIFLISAIGVTLNVMTSRLARIVDRARNMENESLSALFIAFVVVMLFVNAFAHWDLAAFIAIMFILSMLAFAAALTSFLIEVRIATTTLRIGIEAASRNS